MAKKLRVGIVFGGRSSEHEVSVASARSVMAAMNSETYDIIPIAIAKNGQWLPGTPPDALASPKEMAASKPSEHIAAEPPEVFDRLPQLRDATGQNRFPEVDIIFPVLHGAFGEDGTIQGMLELAGLPYVGCGILGSALGIDKEKAKILFRAAGIPVTPWVTCYRQEIRSAPEAIIRKVEAAFQYPVFVKPATLGSSVGVTKAHNANELLEGLQMAAAYDRKILVEQGINCRELECAVLGNDNPAASVVGEVIASKEFYDYESKYLDGASKTLVPAPIDNALAQRIREYAIKAFQALDLSGLSRVDFFLSKDNGAIYLNEVNTLPGFTEISMYPKLWEATGIPYTQLIDRLIELGFERARDRAAESYDAKLPN